MRGSGVFDDASSPRHPVAGRLGWRDFFVRNGRSTRRETGAHGPISTTTPEQCVDFVSEGMRCAVPAWSITPAEAAGLQQDFAFTPFIGMPNEIVAIFRFMTAIGGFMAESHDLMAVIHGLLGVISCFMAARQAHGRTAQAPDERRQAQGRR